MSDKTRWLIAISLFCFFVVIPRAQTQRNTAAPPLKPVPVTRIFTGPDGQSHAEETGADFGPSGVADLHVTGAELHRMAPSSTANWHTGGRRQYVITLTGSGEIEVADGKKIPVEPGHIDLIEDTTGTGHITRNFDERVTLQLPLVDDTGK
jgi:hypothetical protein